jgi:hypothetical protein
MSSNTMDWRQPYVHAQIDALLQGQMSLSYVQQTLLAFRPDPCAPLQWTELPYWIGMILERLTAGKIRRNEAESLLMQALNAG